MIEDSRVQLLNDNPSSKGEYVLYWMQASQRAEYNHALEFAISQANRVRLPVIVYFGLTNKFPEANERHYHFMLEGLNEVKQDLHEKGIGMVIEQCSPEIGATKFARKATLVVCDCGYLRIQKKWREYVSQHIGCPLIQVESDVVVPVQKASSKEEYSAATFRRKLHPMLSQYIIPLEEQTALIDSTRLDFDSYDISDISRTISGLKIDRTIAPSNLFHGGTREAKKRMAEFIAEKLVNYRELRNDPNRDCLSNLSPYLHFGQISSLYIAMEVTHTGGSGASAFLEELIVRRELSMNFVQYNPYYDSFNGLPDWARKTLGEHEKDTRRYIYSIDELEHSRTQDPYWNSAQKEMVSTGKMHGYMRMYWGKKILEWTATPREAYDIILYLNNKYELDGRDPNGFAGTAWCFGKHDRPWKGRPIFGNIRYMSAEGLKRKFDIENYARKYISEDA